MGGDRRLGRFRAGVGMDGNPVQTIELVVLHMAPDHSLGITETLHLAGERGLGGLRAGT